MDIFVLDVETTGLNKFEDKIIEIGMVQLDSETGRVFDYFEKILPAPVSGLEWIFQNSDLSVTKVRNATQLTNLEKGLLQETFSKYYITAFNQAFDFPFLEQMGFCFNKKWVDPMVYLTNKIRIERSWGYKWPSVEEAYEFLFNEKITETHRAIEDARLEAKICFKLIEKYRL